MTWEPSENIPKFIRDHFEQTGRTSIPLPKISKIKKSGSQEFYLLQWDDDASKSFVPKEDFEIKGQEEQTSTCNTKKHHGRLFYRYTAGILIAAYPCGNITVYSQLYGAESLTQVKSPDFCLFV